MSLATYTVHEPPAPDADRMDRADQLEFVRDGFSWLTALCPPLGLIASRQWLVMLAYVVGVSAIVAALMALKVDNGWIGVLVLAVNIYLGFEASTLKRWTLDHAGWSTAGIVSGGSLTECERRFFESWLPAQPIISAPDRAGPSSTRVSRTPKSALWPFGEKA